MAIAFERATEIAARQLARYRTGWDDLDAEPTENEKLLAGHIVGALWGNDLLNTAGEEWVTVSDSSKQAQNKRFATAIEIGEEAFSGEAWDAVLNEATAICQQQPSIENNKCGDCGEPMDGLHKGSCSWWNTKAR